MDAIKNAQRAAEAAKEQLRQAVQQAREDGHTWAEIGSALNMSRQAAFKRFGHVTNPAKGKTLKGAHMSIAHIREATERVFDLISTGSYDQLQPLIHPEVREELPASLIAETWARALSDVGSKESFADTHVAFPAGERIEDDDEILGTVVGVTTLNCEAGELVGRVAFDDQRRIVGLLIMTPDTSPLPF